MVHNDTAINSVSLSAESLLLLGNTYLQGAFIVYIPTVVDSDDKIRKIMAALRYKMYIHSIAIYTITNMIASLN